MRGVSGCRSVTWSRSGTKGRFHNRHPYRKCVQSPPDGCYRCLLAVLPPELRAAPGASDAGGLGEVGGPAFLTSSQVLLRGWGPTSRNCPRAVRSKRNGIAATCAIKLSL